MFSIQLNSGVPIYRQVVEQVNRLIDRGHLKKGDLLPSVRVLANELGVNPMTISRAYSVLEQDGDVQRKRGIGMLVCRKPRNARATLTPSITQIVDDAKQLGLVEAELVELIKRQWKKKGKQ